MNFAMPVEPDLRAQPCSLRQRAKLGVGAFRVGRVVLMDDETGCIEDEAGNRFDVVRSIVQPALFDALRVGRCVEFRENAFHSVAELKL